MMAEADAAAYVTVVVEEIGDAIARGDTASASQIMAAVTAYNPKTAAAMWDAALDTAGPAWLARHFRGTETT